MSRLNLRKHIFSQRTVDVWNSLPDDVATAPSLNIGLHTYTLRSSGLFRPMYRSICWHVQLHAHASTVPYNRKEMSHSARNSLIDVLICLD